MSSLCTAKLNAQLTMEKLCVSWLFCWWTSRVSLNHCWFSHGCRGGWRVPRRMAVQPRLGPQFSSTRTSWLTKDNHGASASWDAPSCWDCCGPGSLSSQHCEGLAHWFGSASSSNLANLCVSFPSRGRQVLSTDLKQEALAFPFQWSTRRRRVQNCLPQESQPPLAA